jgi:hypothetical protein
MNTTNSKQPTTPQTERLPALRGIVFLYAIRTNSFGVLPPAKRRCIRHAMSLPNRRIFYGYSPDSGEEGRRRVDRQIQGGAGRSSSPAITHREASCGVRSRLQPCCFEPGHNCGQMDPEAAAETKGRTPACSDTHSRIPDPNSSEETPESQ